MFAEQVRCPMDISNLHNVAFDLNKQVKMQKPNGVYIYIFNEQKMLEQCAVWLNVFFSSFVITCCAFHGYLSTPTSLHCASTDGLINFFKGNCRCLETGGKFLFLTHLKTATF